MPCTNRNQRKRIIIKNKNSNSNAFFRFLQHLNLRQNCVCETNQINKPTPILSSRTHHISNQPRPIVTLQLAATQSGVPMQIQPSMLRPVGQPGLPALGTTNGSFVRTSLRLSQSFFRNETANESNEHFSHGFSTHVFARRQASYSTVKLLHFVSIVAFRFTEPKTLQIITSINQVTSPSLQQAPASPARLCRLYSRDRRRFCKVPARRSVVYSNRSSTSRSPV